MFMQSGMHRRIDGTRVAVVQAEAAHAQVSAGLKRDLQGRDRLHWGEGTNSVSSFMIVHEGARAPGPDHQLYLLKDVAEHEDAFEPIKSDAGLIGDVKRFGGFLLEVPDGVDVTAYNTVQIWCETFSAFITAAQDP